MGIFDRFLNKTVEAKGAYGPTNSAELFDEVTGTAGHLHTMGVYSSQANAHEVYISNPVASRCISLIATNLSKIDLLVFAGEQEVEDYGHPLKKLLNRPNPRVSGTKFLEELTMHLLIHGNAYITRTKGPITTRDAFGNSLLLKGKGELHLLNPIHVQIQEGGGMFPLAYRYTNRNQVVEYPVDQATGACDVLHIKLFHPTLDFRGLPGAAPAWTSILNHNAGQDWNYNTLKNHAAPSQAWMLKTGSLAPEQQKSMLDKIKSHFSGKNVGKPVVLGGEWDIKELARSPKDMEYIEGQNQAARNIALAFGVPSQLVNIPGENTYANYEQAMMALFHQRIIPLIDHITSELTVWLCPVFGPEYEITYDIDSVPALEANRQAKWESVKDVEFLTINEKRALMGYDRIEGGDELPGVNQSAPTEDQEEVVDNSDAEATNDTEEAVSEDAGSPEDDDSAKSK